MATGADTIAAIATARGEAGIGVVRVSGPAVPAIATTLLGRPPQPRHAHFHALRDADGELIDQGLLLYFPAPHSYTGEAVLELHTHGSAVVLDLVLRRVCALGARLAGPGQFSERAFLNGKLDLAQAEAVADLIGAHSEQAARAAVRSLQGVFSERVQVLLEDLGALRAHVEAAIDFPEEEIDFLADPAIAEKLTRLRHDLDTLLAEARSGVRLADGLDVVITGRPNVGKSSLLNALAGEDRAIVTATAGTTRDTLHASLDLDGVSIELVDTAGLREGTDAIEREGVRRARAQMQRADLVLLVTEAGHEQADQTLLADVPEGTARLVVVNKIDLSAADQPEHADAACIRVSAKHGDGLPALRQHLRRLAGTEAGHQGSFSARRRHVLALEATAAHMAAVDSELHASRAGELLAEELRQAQQSLGEVTGVTYPDDLLGRIFSSFCIGK